jgi:hypothetical protein
MYIDEMSNFAINMYSYLINKKQLLTYVEKNNIIYIDILLKLYISFYKMSS